jgi:membrane protease YdiL (CAAX protease family)
VAVPVTAASAASGPAVRRYAVGVVVTALAILSQYFLPQLVPPLQVVYTSLPGDLFIVYGIPVIAFSILVGGGPLRGWARHLRIAGVEGLSWYGLLSLLSLFVIVALTIVYEVVDPSALQLLERQNPVLTQAAGDPWFWVGFSFVVGAFEETIFRGWIFGFWRGRTASWVGPAVGSSLLFAGVHLYYGTTYGAAAPLIFPGLFLLGFAFAATYQVSGGNLVVVALLHGAYDASAFLTIVNLDLGVALRYGLILVGVVIGLLRYLVWGTGPLTGVLRSTGPALEGSFGTSPPAPGPGAPPSG